MCLICFHVRINGRLCGPGDSLGPGHHYGTHQSTMRRHRNGRTERRVCTDTPGIEKGGTVLTAHLRSTDSVKSPTTDYRPSAADHRSTDEAVLAPAVEPYTVIATNTDSDEHTGRGQDATPGTRGKRGSSTRTVGHDPGRRAIWWGSPQLEKAVSECLNVGSQGNLSCSPGS
jgi:hypothetical protein